MKVNRLIVWNSNSTNEDEQPAATIIEGKNFKARLKVLFEQHYDPAPVTDLKIIPCHRIRDSFDCTVKVEGRGEEEFVLLKSWDY